MNGMSLVMSKPCCPMYNFCTSNRIGLIPRPVSNLQLQRISPLLLTARMLKQRAYSISAVKDGKGGLRSQVPKYALLGVGIIGIALAKHWEFVAQSVSAMGGIGEILKSIACFLYYSRFLALFVAGRYLSDFLLGVAALLQCKPFSIGDIIEVGSVKGQVIEMGLITTSLLSADNAPIKVPNSLFFSQGIANKSRASCCPIVSKIFVLVDEIDKIPEISEEIIKMMKSHKNVYLDKRQPYCWFTGFKKNCVELTLGCNLKKMCEDELHLEKQDVLMESAQIIKKHGASVVEHMGEGN